MKSQNLEILAWLKQGRGITPGFAKDAFGVERLAARIYDIRRMGYTVKDLMIKVKTRRGYTHVKRYSLTGIPK